MTSRNPNIHASSGGVGLAENGFHHKENPRSDPSVNKRHRTSKEQAGAIIGEWSVEPFSL